MKEKQENLAQKVVPFGDFYTGIDLEIENCFNELNQYAQYFSDVLRSNPFYIMSSEFQKNFDSFEATNRRLEKLMEIENREYEQIMSRYKEITES